MKKSLYIVAMAAMMAACAPKGGDLTMYVGTYTHNNNSTGLYSVAFNEETGEWHKLDSAAVGNPSYLALDGDKLYCVSEFDAGQAGVSGYRLGENGSFEPINAVAIDASAPCFIAVAGEKVFTANYNSFSVSLLRRDSEGRLGENVEKQVFDNPSRVDTLRQSISHLHTVMPIPESRQLIASDLGGDCLYRFDDDFQHCDTIALPAGCGPRHIAFGKGGMMYVVTEISDEVLVMRLGEQPELLQRVPVSGVNPKGAADIHISPDGRFLYASERLESDGIGIFRILESGLLESAGYQSTGVHPRNFVITPNGKYLLAACRDSNSVEVYRRSIDDGTLSLQSTITLPAPVCLKFGE